MRPFRQNRSSPVKPLCLLADSQLLFLREKGDFFLESVREFIESEQPKAAYIGASNNDDPVFYEIFVAAMESIGDFECRMIPSTPTPADIAFLDAADIILLAGGDVKRGWETLVRNGLREMLVRRYFEGVVLIGVSAGAVQLGRHAWSEGVEITKDNLFKTFALFPAVVSVHDEKEGWQDLKDALNALGDKSHGICIPRGGGIIYYGDGFIEPFRYPVQEFSMQGEQLNHNLLLPVSIEEAHTHNTEEIEGIH